MDFSEKNMSYKQEYYKVLPIKHNFPLPEVSDNQSDDSVTKLIKGFKEAELQALTRRKLTKKEVEETMPEYILKDNPDA
jgi:hypothetical protein